jgi:hypothetical protein
MLRDPFVWHLTLFVLGALGTSAWVNMLQAPQLAQFYWCSTTAESLWRLLSLSYRVYAALLERIVNKTPMLEVLLEALYALELLKLLGPLEASELKTHDVF